MFAWFILLLLGVIWGASYLFIKIGGAEIPPLTFVAVRTIVASGALIAAMMLRREQWPNLRRMWMPLVAMGIFNGVIPYTLITWGELHITSGLAAILTAAMPLFTVLIGHLWTRDERLTAIKTVGIIIGFLGVIVLFLPDLQQGVQMEFWGEFAVVGAAASYGLSTIVAHKYMHGVTHTAAAAGQLGTAALIMIPLSLLFENPFSLHPSPIAIGSLVTLALLGTSFAYVLYYWLVENTGATRTALVTYLIPITALVWGVLFLAEPLAWEDLAGLALIILGIVFVNRTSVPAPQPAAFAPAEGE